jgi:hypothetical protein
VKPCTKRVSHSFHHRKNGKSVQLCCIKTRQIFFTLGVLFISKFLHFLCNKKYHTSVVLIARKVLHFLPNKKYKKSMQICCVKSTTPYTRKVLFFHCTPLYYKVPHFVHKKCFKRARLLMIFFNELDWNQWTTI